MKTTHTLIALLLTSSVNAQAFFGMQGTNKGFGIQAGYTVSDIELTIAHKLPYRSSEIPTVTSLSAGYNLYPGSLTLTPTIGIGAYESKDFTKYGLDPTGRTGPEITKGLKPFYSLELGKDMSIARVFLSANYCGHFYYGIGIKGFFK